MLEHNLDPSSLAHPPAAQPAVPSAQQAAPCRAPSTRLLLLLQQTVNTIVPDFRTPDALALELARRTPLTIAICFTLLVAGIIGSRLHVWQANFLWGIPALGAISMGMGFWLWSISLLSHPALSAPVRAALGRATRLQWSMVTGGGLALIYFLGMAVGFWH